VNSFLVICPTAPGRLDGVADYACWLTAHLSAHAPAYLVGLSDDDAAAAAGAPSMPDVRRVTVSSWRELWAKRREAPFSHGAALLQYVPQLYLRSFGFAWLVLWLASLRVRGRPIAVTVHEYAVPASGSFRRAAARLAMMFVILVIGSLATNIVVTFELTRRRLGRLLFWKTRRIAVVPVGSNIHAPTSTLPHQGDTVTCTIFGQPAAMHAPLVCAVGAWLTRAGGRVRVRWIGRSKSAIQAFLWEHCGQPAESFEIAAGRAPEEVSALLAASDLCLAPIVDGVSSRRTTVVAALAHGLPIIGTDGICTDDVFRGTDACRLVPPGDSQGFVRDLETLVADAERRRQGSRAARALFDGHFTWDLIARAYVAHLNG
jgi:hypothetical protein